MNKYIIALFIALSATSFSSIFIRLTPASALVIAFWRQFLASIFTFLLIIFSKQFKHSVNFSRNNFLYFLLAGFFLALHFATWILSLSYTTIAQSLVIVNASPAMVVILGYLFLNEHINRYQISGIVISIIGGFVIAFDSIQPSIQASNPAFGNFLAFIGALTFSGYIIIGRIIRKTYQINLFIYTFYVYTISTIFLFLIALLFSSQELVLSLVFRISFYAYVGFFLLAGVSTLLGHSLYNYALKEIKAAIVSIVTLGEPIISSILAIFILSEYPTIMTIIGGFIVILGVFVTIGKENEEESTQLEIMN